MFVEIRFENQTRQKTSGRKSLSVLQACLATTLMYPNLMGTPVLDNVDLNAKLEEWGIFYNFNRRHGAFKGKNITKH